MSILKSLRVNARTRKRIMRTRMKMKKNSPNSIIQWKKYSIKGEVAKEKGGKERKISEKQ